jgi:diguanylate cyclase (GGDEF)-like protein/hemerythrin-like metal-binding protein/PAS domain S-box-containing protein
MGKPDTSSTYLDASPDAIFVADAGGRIHFASRRGVAMLGQASADALQGRALTDFVEREDAPRLAELLGDLCRGPTEVRFRAPGAPALWTEANAERVPGPDGEDAVVVVVRDVSRRKQAEAELRAAKARAEETLREVVRSLQELEREAATDTLTGLWNRRHFEQVMAVELARCRRYSQVSSLVLVDLDHFKQVNDRFGHDAGDRTLAACARVIARTTRTSDSACRWGGEEFAILAPGVTAEAAVRLADRIRGELAAVDLGVPSRVTLSAGVAQVDPLETLEQWLKRADRALYRAKEAGRDRVELATSRGDLTEGRLFRLVWDPAYECGEPLVDEQHRALFSLANALMDEVGSGGATAIRVRLSALVAHAAAHFSDEERVLERVGFAERAQHMALHRALVEEATRLESLLDAGRLSVHDLVSFLVGRVVRDHLLGADTLFFPAVAAARGGAGSGSPALT